MLDVEKPAGGFSLQKRNFLSKPDKSGIGGIDRAIKGLVDSINSSKEHYTTSSCAGRIALMKETGKKQEKVFVFVTHSNASFERMMIALKNSNAGGMIYLKHEPCILHVACKTPEDAEKLVNMARQSGWKKSGIIGLKEGKIMAEMVSTEILAAPVADKGKILISEDYLRILVKEANKKLKQTRQKISSFEKKFIESY